MRGDEVTASCEQSDRHHAEELNADDHRHEAESEEGRRVCQWRHLCFNSPTSCKRRQGTGTYYKFNYFPLTKGENVTFLLSYIKY